MEKRKIMKTLLEVSRKLNLSSKDYFAYSGNRKSLDLFPEILGSVKTAVVNEIDYKANKKLRKKRELNNIKFIDSLSEFDRDVFNKFLCFYDQDAHTYSDKNNTAISKMLGGVIKSCENLGMVLVCDIPHNERKKSNGILRYDKSFFESYLDSRGIYERWFLDGNSEDSFDLLFRVRKYKK